MLGRKTNIHVLILCVFLSCLNQGIIYAQAQSDLFRAKPPKPAVVPLSTVKKDLFVNRIYAPLREEKRSMIWRWFNTRAYASPRRVDYDRRKLRQEWANAVGIDLFYPYFKAQEIKEVVQDKTRVEVFHMRGRAEFDEDTKQIKYIFKRKF